MHESGHQSGFRRSKNVIKVCRTRSPVVLHDGIRRKRCFFDVQTLKNFIFMSTKRNAVSGASAISIKACQATGFKQQSVKTISRHLNGPSEASDSLRGHRDDVRPCGRLNIEFTGNE